MKHQKTILPNALLLAALATILVVGTHVAADVLAQPRTQFLPGQTWPDDHGIPINAHGGGVIFHAGTYYWFGQHMIAGEAGNNAQIGVHVYSSTDFYNWKDEGIALKVSADLKSEIIQGCILERPKVIYNPATKKFVMWFHLEIKDQGYRAARSGVAVAESVTGPYTYVGSVRPNAGIWPENLDPALRKPLTAEESADLAKRKFTGGSWDGCPDTLVLRRDFADGQMARDMTLFVDNDGKAYHIYSAEENGTIQISQLTADYLRPAGKYIRLLPGKFNEAPALFKHGGKYFLITSGTSGWAPNAARLASADSIFGPWQELGNPCVGTDEQKAKTFYSQSTHVLPVSGKLDAFIFMGDRWQPTNAIDGRHIWLPIHFDAACKPSLQWQDRWDLSVFN